MDRFFPRVSIPMSMEYYHRLPRVPGFKWEYWDGCLQLTERMNVFHATMPLERRDVRTELEDVRPMSDNFRGVRIRPLEDADWEALPRLMRSAFCNTLPFSIIDEEKAVEASETLLRECRDGEEGPLVPEACFVAEEMAKRFGEGELSLVSAVLVTRRKRRHFTRYDYREEEPVEKPHLTWAMTRFWGKRAGVGSELLGHAVNALLGLGWDELDSTFMEGNHASTLWHWRNGFVLRPGLWSQRAMAKQIEEGRAS